MKSNLEETHQSLVTSNIKLAETNQDAQQRAQNALSQLCAQDASDKVQLPQLPVIKDPVGGLDELIADVTSEAPNLPSMVGDISLAPIDAWPPPDLSGGTRPGDMPGDTIVSGNTGVGSPSRYQKSLRFRSSLSKMQNQSGVDAISDLNAVSGMTPVGLDDDAKPVRTSAFRIKGRSIGKGIAKAVFWPAGKVLAHDKLADVLFQTWNMARPNLIINIDAGAAHPAKFSTKQLRELPQFRQWCELAECQRQLGCSRGANVPIANIMSLNPAEPPREDAHRRVMSSSLRPFSSHSDQVEAALPAPLPVVTDQDAAAAEAHQENTVNDCIFNKLVSIFAAVIDASAKTNNYILVDRTQATGSSSSAELLLELALERSEASPTILVIERLSRLREFSSQEAFEQLDAISKLEQHSVPHGADQHLRTVEIDSLYSAREFTSEDIFRGGKYCDYELPSHPDPEHVLPEGQGIDVQFVERLAEDSDGCKMGKATLNRKRLWQYHYSQYLFASGTHYVFLEDDDQLFNSEALGSIGAVFAHGGTKAFHRMHSWLQQGRPCVMLWNSGGVTQAFASLHSAIVRSGGQDLAKILRTLEIVSGENWAQWFGLAQCNMMCEMQKRAPFLIRKAIVSVDILNDSAEDVLQVVTGCFSLGLNKLPELGLRTAEAHSVLRAWRQHLILHASAEQNRRLADVFFFLQTFFLLLTSVSAAMKVESVLNKSWSSETFLQDGPYWASIALPILTGLVSSAMQQQRFHEKWCALWSSSMSIVTEIYKFRSRVLEYDSDAVVASPDQDEETDTVKEPARMARVIFVKRVQQIFADAVEGEMTLEPLRVNRNLEDPNGKCPVHEGALRKHVRQKLLHLSEPGRTLGFRLCCGCKRRRYNRRNDVGLSSEVSPDELFNTKDIYNVIDEDDYKTTLSIEEYMEHRMKPLMKHFEAKSPRHSFYLRALNSISTLLNAVIVGMAVPQELNIGHWLTACVSCKVLVLNVIDYKNYAVQLRGLNSGVKELQNLLTWWESLSVIDRRTRQAKTQAVVTVEQAVLKAFTARTGEVPSVYSPAVVQKDDGNAENEDKKGAKSKNAWTKTS